MGLELFGAIVIAVAIIVGAGAHYFSGKDDSPIEQVSEQILKTKGIDIDFSADAKRLEEDKAHEPKAE